MNLMKKIFVLFITITVLNYFLLANHAFAQFDLSACDDPEETCCPGGQGILRCDTSKLPLYCNLEARPAKCEVQKTFCTLREGGIGIDTAVGCIPIRNQTEFVGFILRWAIGIGGGIAFLLLIFAGFQIVTSSGNPERLKAGQQLLISAISGIILLVFSVFILKTIGVDILGIPGL